MTTKSAPIDSFSIDTLNAGIVPELGHATTDSIKQSAHQELANLSFPGPRDEEWLYTNIRSVSKNAFVKSGTTDLDSVTYDTASVPEATNSTIVFVNGIFSRNLSKIDGLPEGVILVDFKDALEKHASLFEKYFNKINNFEGDYFALLNTSQFEDGVFIYIPKELKLEQTIHLVYLTTGDEPVATFPRNLIVAERHSEFTVVEEYVGEQNVAYLTASLSEVLLGDEAKMAHIRLQKDGLKAFHINRIVSQVERGADLQSYTISLGANLFRNDVRAVINGEGAHATLDGLVLVSEDQLSDTHSIMDHRVPHCTSHQLHKTIVDGSATSVFNGKIFVRKDAQKTDAFQENHNLQLSRNGNVYTKPQLEIFADDVKCSHGATVGQLNEEQEFYLRSRGLNDNECRELLTYGFATAVIESLPVESIKDDLKSAVNAFTKRGIKENQPA